MNTKLKSLAVAIALAPLAASVAAEGIEEIVVTAQKRAENVQDVPISISAYSGEFIEQSGVNTLSDLAAYTPNFSMNKSSQESNARIIVRGVGSVGNSAIEPSVGVFIDGVYYPRPGAVIGNLMDIQTVEVLRGPQGTLFGRNTPMGALNITTRSPSDEFEANIQAGAGTYGERSLGGTISGALSDNVRARLSGTTGTRESYGKNTFADSPALRDRENTNLRGKLSFDVNDALTVNVTADYSSLQSGGSMIEVLNGTSTPLFEGTINALFGESPTTGSPYDFTINQHHGDSLDDEQSGIAVDATYELASGHSLRSITAKRTWEANVNESALRLPADLFARLTDYETDTFSQEFQLLSPQGQDLEYVAGLFYYDESYDIRQGFGAGTDLCNPVISAMAFQQALAATGDQAYAAAVAQGAALDCMSQTGPEDRVADSNFNQDLSSIAVFGQATYHMSEAWKVTMGGRYSKDDKTGDFVQVINNSYIDGLLRSAEEVLNMERNDAKATWFANTSYSPSDDVMLFATLSTGYKSGGFNSEGAADALGRERRIFAPETATNMEVGIKSKWLDNTLMANFTLFRTDLDDFQDRTFDGLSFVVLNAGELRQQGVEADFVYQPIDQLRLTGGFSYLDSEYLSFENASGLPGGAPQDLTGERKPYSPEWQSSLVAHWEDAISGNLNWFVRGETQFMDEANIGANSNNNPQTVQAAYSLVNARLGLAEASGQWSLALFGKNLTGEEYCVNMFDQPFGEVLGAVNPEDNTSVQRCVLGEPKTAGVEVKYNF